MSTANLVEVKPCPFCGSDEIIAKMEEYNLPSGTDESVKEVVGKIVLSYCECEGCRSRGPSLLLKDEKILVKVWNTRSEG